MYEPSSIDRLQFRVPTWSTKGILMDLLTSAKDLVAAGSLVERVRLRLQGDTLLQWVVADGSQAVGTQTEFGAQSVGFEAI